MLDESSEIENSVDRTDQATWLRQWGELNRTTTTQFDEPASWDAAARMVAALKLDSGRAQNPAETIEPNSEEVLQRWGTLGSRFNRVAMNQYSWEAAARMVAAAEYDSKGAATKLTKLLSESSKLFAPLGDPLDSSLDFGAHRWLEHSREEAYSDWLAWVIQQQQIVKDVLALFDVSHENLGGETITVEREVAKPPGRLDLLIEFGDNGTLVVEVKTNSEPDVEQLDRYSRWLSEQSAPLQVVLLAYEEPLESLPENVRFCSWERVAMLLRSWAHKSRMESSVKAALTLAFCGAIEQNILGFGTVGLEALRTANYLEAWMNGERNAKH